MFLNSFIICTFYAQAICSSILIVGMSGRACFLNKTVYLRLKKETPMQGVKKTSLNEHRNFRNVNKHSW